MNENCLLTLLSLLGYQGPFLNKKLESFNCQYPKKIHGNAHETKIFFEHAMITQDSKSDGFKILGIISDF
jgi:hypothetical protein